MKKVKLIICLMVILFIAGCSWSSNERIDTEPRPEPIKGLYRH